MIRCFFVLLTVIMICGCRQQDERNHPLYQKALKAQSAGNGSDAAMIFNELLKRRPRSVLAHLKLAAVYDELLNDPAMAVVHYRAYLDDLTAQTGRKPLLYRDSLLNVRLIPFKVKHNILHISNSFLC